MAKLSDELARNWSFSGSYAEDDSTGSWASKSLVKLWYDTCLKEHRLCAPKSRTMPTRVIDLGKIRSLDNILLHKPPREQKDAFIAVSHQWGEAKTRKQFDLRATKKSELPPFFHWPRVFQDAFLVAKALGIRYIWIDNVCIDQEDRDDWNRESGKMAEYYGNAALVIAASKANNWTEGCFNQRNPLVVRPCRITFSRFNPAACSAPCVWVMNQDLHDNGIKKHPLHGRAWVLQEELLPRRLIRYGLSQISWECLEQEVDEQWPKFGRSVGRGRCENPENHRKAVHFPVSSPYTRNKGYDAWYALIEELTKRNMTLQKDTLPAISGLANKMASTVSKTDVYLAGLWGGDLATGLLWASGSDWGKLKLSSEQDNFDRKDFTSPSWSWVAESHHRVFFNFDIRIKPGDVPGKQLCMWVARTFIQKSQPVGLCQSACPTEIIKSHIELRTPDSPYGEVLSGRIRFRTILVGLRIFYESKLKTTGGSRWSFEVCRGENPHIRAVNMDRDSFIYPGAQALNKEPFSGDCILDSLAELSLREHCVQGCVKAWFLPLLQYRAENLTSPETRVMGLALVRSKTGRSTEYKRIGRASIDMEFDDDFRLCRLPTEEIDII
ncbi:hypothetical protein MMC27_005175 [Xylographa pallens]|nr:hypothetical protein [Xylographa pallens]